MLKGRGRAARSQHQGLPDHDDFESRPGTPDFVYDPNPLLHRLRAEPPVVDLRGYLEGMIAARRRRPHDDLLGKFVAVEADGQRLSEVELINTCVTLFTAGHETTLSFIANTVLLLLRHADQTGDAMPTSAAAAASFSRTSAGSGMPPSPTARCRAHSRSPGRSTRSTPAAVGAS